MTSRRALVVFLAGTAILLLGLAAWLGRDMIAPSATSFGSATSGSGTALIGGPFELVDQSGATRTEADFKGRYMLIYFGYTFCPDICPTSLLSMTRALESLEESAPATAEQIVPIFITVDPERDSVEVIRDYAGHFHADMVALTGSDEQVATAAQAYRVYYRKAESEDASDYLVDHSGFIYLMDREGGYLRHFSHNATPEEIAEGLMDRVGS